MKQTYEANGSSWGHIKVQYVCVGLCSGLYLRTHGFAQLQNTKCLLCFVCFFVCDFHLASVILELQGHKENPQGIKLQVGHFSLSTQSYTAEIHLFWGSPSSNWDPWSITTSDTISPCGRFLYLSFCISIRHSKYCISLTSGTWSRLAQKTLISKWPITKHFASAQILLQRLCNILVP